MLLISFCSSYTFFFSSVLSIMYVAKFSLISKSFAFNLVFSFSEFSSSVFKAIFSFTRLSFFSVSSLSVPSPSMKRTKFPMTGAVSIPLEIGSRIQLIGRIQSREYQKRISENQLIKRVAYEVSVNKLEFHEKDKE